jgi:hypothetical protein
MPVMDRNVSLGDGGGDDLPRTFRRERDAQQRAQQQLQQTQQTPSQRMAMPTAPAPVALQEHDWDHDQPQKAIVTKFKVPFFSLMMFYLKSVIAAIPAIILLVAILWGLGHVLVTYFPWLVKVQILIQVPK